MKYFFDTEFIEDGESIDLLSIGIVAEDGREYYACNAHAKLDHADEWVIFNVYPQLPIYHARDMGFKWQKGAISKFDIRDQIREFVKLGTFNSGKPPEFWAYYADYDWVVLCQLFGRMIELPEGWPMYCRDVKQLCESLGNPKLPEQTSKEHHALSDARWTKQAYEFLVEPSRTIGG